MAPENERITKAFKAMKSLGVNKETAKPVLVRLLKLYNKKWELIEEDNYRTLADAIFEFEDDKLKAEKNGDTLQEDIEPPFKKPYKGNSEDQVSSTGGNGKSIADQDEGEVPISSCGTRMVESPQSVSRDPIVEPHHGANESPSSSKFKDPIQVNSAPGSTSTSQHSDTRMKILGSSSTSNIQTTSQTTYDIASSTCGKVKVSLTCNHTVWQHNFRSADDVLSFAEKSCKIFCKKTVGDQFSVVKFLNQLCESYLEMDSVSVEASCQKALGSSIHHSLDHPNADMERRVFHRVNDITKGSEKVKISLLDEIGNEAMPRFIYCSNNITYESAYVQVSLARISDEDCCSDCKGNCLSSPIPCACARDTGGEFAYTRGGLLSEEFLRSCISMKVSPQNQHLFYCQDCPLERAKNVNTPGKCKGHLLRKFIKECWRKCGCTMQCGNRVVQRGISRKLQVFVTSEGKGWGLRTLEKLPKGAFVCEYVGEILTNIELYERNNKSSGEEKHVYPVLLDADWATEGTLKDEDALCLDATNYGNVARFINHRCYDGNLLEVPVQVETPDRHYYHLAFFSNREVDALEELTWDYEIDFDDNNHPVKAFQCSCGSQYCRDRKGKKLHSTHSRMVSS